MPIPPTPRTPRMRYRPMRAGTCPGWAVISPLDPDLLAGGRSTTAPATPEPPGWTVGSSGPEPKLDEFCAYGNISPPLRNVPVLLVESAEGSTVAAAGRLTMPTFSGVRKVGCFHMRAAAFQPPFSGGVRSTFDLPIKPPPRRRLFLEGQLQQDGADH